MLAPASRKVDEAIRVTFGPDCSRLDILYKAVIDGVLDLAENGELHFAFLEERPLATRQVVASVSLMCSKTIPPATCTRFAIRWLNRPQRRRGRSGERHD